MATLVHAAMIARQRLCGHGVPTVCQYISESALRASCIRESEQGPAKIDVPSDQIDQMQCAFGSCKHRIRWFAKEDMRASVAADIT